MIRPSDRDQSQTTVNQAARRKRPTAALPEKLEKRLMGYALAAGAAGVGVLALAPPAKADIIHTSANLDLGAPGSLLIRFAPEAAFHTFPEFNLNGQSHFYNVVLRGVLIGTVCTECLGGAATYGPFLAQPGGLGLGIEGGPLPKGAEIGPSNNFVTNAFLFRWSHRFGGTVGGAASLSESGPWAGQAGYLGVKFLIGGQVHYAWIAAQQTQFRDLHVSGWAYDTRPNAPVFAGQITPEPGSGSLVALALGSLGLGLWRRRKAATSEKV